jgi:hypothetical protein
MHLPLRFFRFGSVQFYPIPNYMCVSSFEFKKKKLKRRYFDQKWPKKQIFFQNLY